MQAIRFEQGPDDDLPYTLDFAHLADELLTADPIASASVINTPTVTVPPLAIASPLTVSGTNVTMRVSGGTDGTTYRIEVKATTAAGRDKTAFIDFAVNKAPPAET